VRALQVVLAILCRGCQQKLADIHNRGKHLRENQRLLFGETASLDSNVRNPVMISVSDFVSIAILDVPLARWLAIVADSKSMAVIMEAKRHNTRPLIMKWTR